MKKEEFIESNFDILVSNPNTFQSISMYAHSRKIIDLMRLGKEESSIRRQQVLDWQIFINEHKGPLYAAVLNGWNFCKCGGTFDMSSLNMSIATLGKILRDRKPTTFEEVAIWSAIYCDLAHREVPAKGYQIGESIERYTKWLYKLNSELSGVGIPYNHVDDHSALSSYNVLFIYFVEA